MRTVLIDYGAGNLHSVDKALGVAGLAAETVSDPAQADGADVLVLPGQGHFGQVMASFAASGFEPLVRAHVAADRPFLGICVGLQLLMEGSEEAPDVPGLGVLSGRVRRFPQDGPSVPQMGWNRVWKVGDPALLSGVPDGFHAYFANSYWVDFDEPGLVGGRTRYGDVEFLSAVSRGSVHATQFHPEKSQRAGLRILRAFGDAARAALGVAS
ncbi:MAG: imidazole glycerol phosphate synthase subunit HisH [Trueperaceae bacterium]|nr:imidazole glycerol phosphate synthase subunit HisH [Trueperaceae bacterium]